MLSRLFKPQFLKNVNSGIIQRSFGSGHGNAYKPDDRNDATSQFLESVSSTLKGITHVNYVVEHDKNLTEEKKQSMKRFLVYRYDPSVKSFPLNKIIIFFRMNMILPSTLATMFP